MLTAKDMGVSGANTAGRFPSIGSIVARCSSDTRRIGGNGPRSFFGRPIVHLPHPRAAHPVPV